MATHAVRRHYLRWMISFAAIVFLVSLLLGGLTGCGGGGGNGGDNENGGDPGNGAPDPAPDPAPLALSAAGGDGKVILEWTDVDGVDSHTVYYATAGEIQPDNFGIWVSQYNGVMIENVTSPHAVRGLDNGTRYFFVVTSTSGGEESAPSNEVTALPQGSISAVRPLNDTGIDWCSDGGDDFLDCPVAAYPGQDGDFGRDAAARMGTLEKVGSGDAGFDFTKIANDGSELPASATLGIGPQDWACTRDNVTGLTWEVKTSDGGLRDRINTYSWYQPDGLNMGVAGNQDEGSCGGSSCDTTGFVKAVNNQGLCGASDWRLPTVSELLSILHLGGMIPAVDAAFFPNTRGGFYWSSLSHAPFGRSALSVDFGPGGRQFGAVQPLDKGPFSQARVRVVRISE